MISLNNYQPAQDFSYFAAAASAGASAFTKGPCRGIRIGGGGILYVVTRFSAGAEVLYAEDVEAGEQFAQEFLGIGPSTTCTKITVMF